MYTVVSQNFSTFLNKISDYSSFLSNFQNYSDNLLDLVSDGGYIRKEFREKINRFPKYPYNYTPITKMGLFNINKIYEVIPKLPENLRGMVSDSLLSLKSELDKIPESKKDLFTEIYLQKLYIEDIQNDNFNRREDLLASIYNIGEKNYFYKISIGNNISEINNLEFFQQLTNILFLSKNIKRITNTFSQFSKYFYSYDFINESRIRNSIDLFFNDSDKKTDFLEKVTRVVLRVNYKLIEYSEELEQIIKDTIDQSIPDLKDKIESYILSYSDNINRNILLFHSELFYNLLSTEILKNQCSSDNSPFLNPEDYLRIWKNLPLTGVRTEEQFIGYFLSRITPNTINNYMLIWYIYSKTPEKFINVLPFIIEKLIDDIVFSPLDREYLNKTYIESPLKNYYKSINFENYTSIVNDLVNKNNLEYYSSNSEINKMVIYLTILDRLDDFFNSDLFEDYINSMAENIFKVLKDNGFINYTYNWKQEIDSVIFFFNLYFKNMFFNNSLFNDITSELENIFTDFLKDNFEFREGEVLSDNIGDKKNFFTKYQFNESSLVVYIDGSIVNDDQYFMDGEKQSIIFNTSPSGTKLTADYDPYYPKEFGINEDTLTSLFLRFTGSKTNLDLITSFMNNMYYTTLTKQTYLNILNNYLL